MKRIDPRVARTRRMFLRALMDLIVEKSYDNITIRDIVQRAEVNRSTFYLHFHDKQDIFAQMTEEVLNDLAKAMHNATYTYESALHDYKTRREPIHSAVKLFEHVQQYAKLYGAMLDQKEFRDRVTQVMRTEMLQFSSTEMEAAFVSNGIVGLILYWVQNGMKETIMEMSLWLTKVTLYPLGHFE